MGAFTIWAILEGVAGIFGPKNSVRQAKHHVLLEFQNLGRDVRTAVHGYNGITPH